MHPPTVHSLAIVVIARNEGERFQRCIESLLLHGRGCPIVYVDSGSTDGSVAFARARGVEVVELDMARPFTAARARNAGLDRLLERSPQTKYVQFIDGDCEVIEGWLDAGVATMEGDATIAVVSGRLRERFPERTLYNRLGDLEWDRPVGEEKSCGGVAMMRVEAVRAVGGFDAGLIAGEEPELCARIRANMSTTARRIVRVGADMAWHDLAMTTSAQWFKRARRHGHAMLEVSRYKAPASRGLFALQVRSALIWGLVWYVVAGCLGVGILALLVVRSWWAGLAIGALVGWLGLRLVQARKIAGQARARGVDGRTATAYAWLIMDGKRHNVLGMLDYLRRRRRGESARIISYKEAERDSRAG